MEETGATFFANFNLVAWFAEFLGNAEVDVQEVADNCRRSMSGSWKVTFPLLMANDSIPQDEASLTVSFAVTENSRGFTEEEIWQ